MRTAYVYLENQPETDEYDEDISLISYGDERTCLLAYELYNNGLPEGWDEFLREYSSGYYKLKYESDTESEYSEGYVAYSYEIVTEPLILERSFRARWLDFVQFKINPVVSLIRDLFTKAWSVDLDWGGAGITKTSMFLPQAIWYKFIGHKSQSYPNMVGEYKTILRRTYW